MIGTRTKHQPADPPPDEVIPEAEIRPDQTDSAASADPSETRYDVTDLLTVIREPLTDNATAEDVAAETARHRQASGEAADRAERDQAEYDARMDAARQEAARIIAEAEVQARPLAESAAEAARASAALQETASRLDNAARHAVKAEAAEAGVHALEDERAELTAKDADLGQRRGALASERGSLETQLAAARDSADLDAMTSLRNRIDSISDVDAALGAQQAAVQARLQAIGDGSLSPIWPQKELYEVRRAADSARRTALDALHWAQPDSPAAIRDARRRHEQELARFRADRSEAEAARRAQAERRVSYVTGS